MKTARQVTAEALLQVEKGGYSNLVLDSCLQKNESSPQDSAFASALFYGVLERRLTLDYCIAAYSKIPPEKLSPAVRELLRMAIYQILYMDSVPETAAVNESVALTRKMGVSSASGFVNGVLRSFLRAGGKVPNGTGSNRERLSIRYSCPLWLVTLLADSYGTEQTEHFLQAALGRPPIYARANTVKTTPQALCEQLGKEGALAQIDPVAAGGIIFENLAAVEKLDSFQQGFFHVQDRSSQLCALALNAKPGMRVADICSAPGGKTFTVAQQMQNSGELLAMDLHQKRANLVQQGAKRLGLSIVKAQQNDGSQHNPELGDFDRILCDVPCSGLGVIRRKPELKYHDPKTFQNLPEIQYKILENSSKYCKIGGRLVYSTCTLNPAENLQVVQMFLREHPEYEPEDFPAGLGISGWHKTFLGTDPDSDGFFMAGMRKKD